MNKKTQKPTTTTPIKLLPHTPVIDKANALAFQQDADKSEHIVIGQQVRELIAIASQHVTSRRNRLHMDEAALLELRIAEADVWTLSKLVDISNSMIADGTFAAGAGGRLIPKTPYFMSGVLYDMSAWKASVEHRWWGIKVEMNHEMTEDIIKSLTAGVAAAGLLALLESASVIAAPKALLTAIVGMILIVGVVRLLLNSQGNGVCIFIPWVPPGAAWISPRPR